MRRRATEVSHNTIRSDPVRRRAGAQRRAGRRVDDLRPARRAPRGLEHVDRAVEVRAHATIKISLAVAGHDGTHVEDRDIRRVGEEPIDEGCVSNIAYL